MTTPWFCSLTSSHKGWFGVILNFSFAQTIQLRNRLAFLDRLRQSHIQTQIILLIPLLAFISSRVSKCDLGKGESSTVDLRMAENGVCKFQVATVHRLGILVSWKWHSWPRNIRQNTCKTSLSPFLRSCELKTQKNSVQNNNIFFWRVVASHILVINYAHAVIYVLQIANYLLSKNWTIRTVLPLRDSKQCRHHERRGLKHQTMREHNSGCFQ